jgi:DNA mismatch repair protein MutL
MSEQIESVINILDEDTANKIAAGEVIERPASVVKELVENALDANATEIRIELVDGGRKLIRVIDNGIGMSRQDARLSIERHATSKIRSADDLFGIRTLGFRGEALPSIASVSKMEIVTRREKDECGTLVVVQGGEVVEVSDIGAPAGTSVTVAELFYNVPARQKFLKTAQTEIGHVVELVNRFAISHCEVDITLIHNDRVIFRSTGSGKLMDAVLTVFGRDAAEMVVEINGRRGAYRVYGFVSKPSYSKPSRSGQMFFVNRRFVRNRNLVHALDDAYRGILPQGRYPLLICFIEVDPCLVDVNVHPTKMEVKFSKEWEIHDLVSSAVRDALSSAAVAAVGSDSLPKAMPSVRKPAVSIRRIGTATPSDLQLFREALASRTSSSDVLSDADLSFSTTVSMSKLEDSGTEEVISTDTDLLADAVVLAQARNTYIIAQSPAGILLIDQHVAHERILFEKLSKSEGEVPVQRLVMPLTLSLGRREALVAENKLEDLRSLGFDMEPFGKDTFLVRSVPAVIAEKNYEQILRDTIEELTELTVAKRLLVQREAIITTTACKMAVKAGERLSLDEMAHLLAELRHTSNPYLCPHGRPIIVCFTNRDLDKMFGRM